MSVPLRITVLADNTARAAGLMAEHGLAFWIEIGDHHILFDTGQGLVLPHNAEALGIDLSTTDDIVLSHGHYDHTGGLPGILPKLARARLTAHPAAFEAKYIVGAGGEVRAVGSPVTDSEKLRPRLRELNLSRTATELAPGMLASGEIRRIHRFEDTGSRFCHDEAGTQADLLLDDQALLLQPNGWTVLILGCCHAGLVNTLDHVADLAGVDRIDAIIGGMHLERASEHRLKCTWAALERYGVSRIAPCHCTGAHAMSEIRQRFPNGYQPVTVGLRWEPGAP